MNEPIVLGKKALGKRRPLSKQRVLPSVRSESLKGNEYNKGSCSAVAEQRCAKSSPTRFMETWHISKHISHETRTRVSQRATSDAALP